MNGKKSNIESNILIGMTRYRMTNTEVTAKICYTSKR